jgi:predicted CoA-substrate-specific enzyme activase
VVHIFFAGVDIGSAMTKVVVNDEARLLASVTYHTDAEHRRMANKVMQEALAKAGLAFGDISYVIATGYGRMNVPFADAQITELTCHARGLASIFPNVRLGIDVGGQDAKALRIKDGRLVDFVMNDKCAAGTGRFLEIIAAALGLRVEELGAISSKATAKVAISNTCTVFAEQEVVARLTEGVPIENIVAGLHDSIAGRVARMTRKLRIEPDVVFTGGVAKNSGVVRSLEEHLGLKLLVPDEPLLSGALGAALLGRDMVMRATAKNEPVQRGPRRMEAASFFS